MFHTPPSSPAAWEEKAERHTCHPMFHTPPSSPAARERKGAGGKVRATRRTWQHRPGNRRHPVPAHREATFHRARSFLPPPSPSSPAAWEGKAELHTCHPIFHTPLSSPAARERKGAGGKVRATRRTWQHRPGNRRHPKSLPHLRQVLSSQVVVPPNRYRFRATNSYKGWARVRAPGNRNISPNPRRAGNCNNSSRTASAPR